MPRTLSFVVVATMSLCGLCAQIAASNKELAPTLSVEVTSKQREFKTGEPWVVELKATVSAPKRSPVKIRAWSRFFGEYEVLPEADSPIDEANLSDVLSTGGQIWRDGVPVVLWNVPDAKTFSAAAQTSVPANADLSVTFHHSFGAALKSGRFRRKVWFAIVIEPSPNKYMLLFAHAPVDITFVADGAEIDFASFTKQNAEWNNTDGAKLHDNQPIIERTNKASK